MAIVVEPIRSPIEGMGTRGAWPAHSGLPAFPRTRCSMTSEIASLVRWGTRPRSAKHVPIESFAAAFGSSK
jgi:hypothetical protein